MLWPNLLWTIVGVDCQWVLGPCDGWFGPYLVLSDVQVLPILGLAIVGFFTCLRLLLRLVSALFRPLRRLFLTPEQRIMEEVKKQLHTASSEYLRNLK